MKGITSQYQCCFGSLHIRVGAFIVGFVDLLLIFVKLLVALGLCLSIPNHSWPVVSIALYSVVGLFSMLLFFQGLRFYKPSFILQYLVILAVGLCVSLGLLAFSIFSLYLLDETYEEHYREVINESRLLTEEQAKHKASSALRFSTFVTILSLAVCLTSAFVEAWFFIITSNAYSYVVAKTKTTENKEQTKQQQNQQQDQDQQHQLQHDQRRQKVRFNDTTDDLRPITSQKLMETITEEKEA